MPEESYEKLPKAIQEAEEAAASAWREKFGTDPSKPLLESSDLTREEYTRLLKDRDRVTKNASQIPEVNKPPVAAEIDISPERQKLKELYQKLTRALETIGFPMLPDRKNYPFNKDIQLINVNGNFRIEFALPKEFDGTNEIKVARTYESEHGEVLKEEIRLNSQGCAAWEKVSSLSQERGIINNEASKNANSAMIGCEKMVNLISVAIAENPLEKIQARLKEARDKLFAYLKDKDIKQEFSISGIEGTWRASFSNDSFQTSKSSHQKTEKEKVHGAGIILHHYIKDKGIDVYIIWENGDACTQKERGLFNAGWKSSLDHFVYKEIKNPHGLLIEFEKITAHLPKVEKQPENKDKKGLGGFINKLFRRK